MSRDFQLVDVCNNVFDRFLQHCESRAAKKDLAFVTLYGYRNIRDGRVVAPVPWSDSAVDSSEFVFW